MNKIYILIMSFITPFCLATCGGNPLPVPTITSLASSFSPTLRHNQTAIQIDTPLFQRVALSYYLFNSGNSPEFSITAKTPFLTGADDSRVINFNHEMDVLVQGLLNEFEVNQKDLPADPTLSKSFLDINFKLVSPPGKILSLKFLVMVYMKGAAHPNSYSRTITFDLEKGEDVTLDQLFLSGVDYLGTISEFCLAQLNTSPIGPVLDVEGAVPSPENYSNWNLSTEGLVITFDTYQVAAYAAGEQVVTVPYDSLVRIIDPKGPLMGFLP